METPVELPKPAPGNHELIGRSQQMLEVYKDIGRVAPQTVTVNGGSCANVATINPAAADDVIVSVAENAAFTLDGSAEPWEHTESGVMLRYVLRAAGS